MKMKKLLLVVLTLAVIGVVSLCAHKAYPNLPTYPNVQKYISTEQYVKIPENYSSSVDVKDYLQAFTTSDSVQTIEEFYLREMPAYGWELESEKSLRFEARSNMKNTLRVYIDERGTFRIVEIGNRVQISDITGCTLCPTLR